MTGRQGLSTAADRPTTAVPIHLLRRKCACGQHNGGGTCAACASKQKTIQRRLANEQGEMLTAETDSLVQATLGSHGSALGREARTGMESRFGYDFSRVRVHADAGAAKSAHA